jgi:hypothetical protein
MDYSTCQLSALQHGHGERLFLGDPVGSPILKAQAATARFNDANRFPASPASIGASFKWAFQAQTAAFALQTLRPTYSFQTF